MRVLVFAYQLSAADGAAQPEASPQKATGQGLHPCAGPGPAPSLSNALCCTDIAFGSRNFLQPPRRATRPYHWRKPGITQKRRGLTPGEGRNTIGSSLNPVSHDRLSGLKSRQGHSKQAELSNEPVSQYMEFFTVKINFLGPFRQSGRGAHKHRLPKAGLRPVTAGNPIYRRRQDNGNQGAPPLGP